MATRDRSTPTCTPVLPVATMLLALVLSLVAPAAARAGDIATWPFADVGADTAHAEDIAWAAEQGIAQGWDEADGTRTFRPLASVARADTAAFLFRLAGSPAFDASSTGASFADVGTGTAHHDDVLWLAATGVSEGWDLGGHRFAFRPYAAIARADMAAFLYRLAGSPAFDPSSSSAAFADVSPATPHYREVAWLAATGVSEGWQNADGTRSFRPYAQVARADMVAFLHRMSEAGLVDVAAAQARLVPAPRASASFDGNQVVLSWPSSSPDATYSVELRSPDGTWTTRATGLADTTLRFAATPGASYQALVRAHVGDAASTANNVVSLDVPAERSCWLNDCPWWTGGTVLVQPMNTHYTHGRSGHAITRIVVHHNADTFSVRDCWELWQTRPASAHYQVQADGVVGQLVWDDDTAWHATNRLVNQTSIGVEHCNVSDHAPWVVPQATLESGARLVGALCVRYDLGVPTWGVNVFGHSDFANTGCPGQLGLGGSQHEQYMRRAAYWYYQYGGA